MHTSNSGHPAFRKRSKSMCAYVGYGDLASKKVQACLEVWRVSVDINLLNAMSFPLYYSWYRTIFQEDKMFTIQVLFMKLKVDLRWWSTDAYLRFSPCLMGGHHHEFCFPDCLYCDLLNPWFVVWMETRSWFCSFFCKE